MRILHVNNIANVGPTLVEGLRAQGENAEFRGLNRTGAHASFPIKLILSPFRIFDYAKLSSYIHSQPFDIVHIHYASQGLAGLLGRFPYFLHVHGDDVNQNLNIPIISQITRISLENAEGVFYSTPNLETVVRSIRNDAVFLPNPVYMRDSPPGEGNESDEIRILLFIRMDSIKIDKDYLHRMARFSVQNGVRVQAIRWGEMVEFIEREFPAIELIPMRSQRDIFALLMHVDIIVGQQKQGALGMSELEAMLASKPVVANFNFPDAYPEQPPVLTAKNLDEFSSNITELIHDPEKRRHYGSLGRIWVLKYHGLEKISVQLLEQYHQALARRDE